MKLSCGFVGLPNAGKSTLFNALTSRDVIMAPRAFSTIDPNVGEVAVPDARLDALAKLINPKSIRPTTCRFVDIAGLVRGASSGEGLGSQFLAAIREVPVIAHVVRCFQNSDVVHVDVQSDPIEDLATIMTELSLADTETLDRARVKAKTQARNGTAEARDRLQLLEEAFEYVNQGEPISKRQDLMTDPSIMALHLLTAKRALVVANVDGADTLSDQAIKLKEEAASLGFGFVPLDAETEREIAQMSTEEQADMRDELGFAHSGLSAMIQQTRELLKIHSFFTAGEQEVAAWTIRQGATARQAAGEIHRDMETGFIRAETTSYDAYIAAGTLAEAKKRGDVRLEGKDYIVHDGDIMHFRFQPR